MRTVIVSGARAPVALHWARLFKVAGWRVVLADTFRMPISRATRFKDVYVRLPGPLTDFAAYLDALRRVVDEERPALWMPTCEEVFFLAAARDLHGVPLPLLAPPFGVLAAAHDKFRFSQAVAGMPVEAPRSWLVKDAADLAPLVSRSRELVFKPVWSRFGDRALRRPEPEQIADGRFLGGVHWVAQDYLPGEEVSAFALAHGGRVLAVQPYRGLFRASAGAAVAFAPFDDPQIGAFVTAYATATAWTGQLSFDFRRDAEGRLFVIECNPRATSGLHFFAPGDGLVKAALGEGKAVATDRRPMTLGLALATYGLADAISNRKWKEWRKAWAQCADITDFPGDRGFLPVQFAALTEIAAIAARRRCSLKTAAMDDTEWNGQPL